MSIALIGGLLLGVGCAPLQSPRVEDCGGSDWARVDSLSELKATASDVVVAKIVGVSEGPTYSPTDCPDAKTRTRDVKLRVIERVRGTAVPEEATLAHYLRGSPDYGTRPPATPRVGERYLLFLSKSEAFKDRWVTSTYDGRIKIGGRDRLKPALPGGISDQVKAMGLKKLKRYVSKDG